MHENEEIWQRNEAKLADFKRIDCNDARTPDQRKVLDEHERRRDEWMLRRDAKRAAEYVGYAATWINALGEDDADAGKARWRDERNLRNAANVKCEDREALLDRLNRKFPSHTLS